MKYHTRVLVAAAALAATTSVASADQRFASKQGIATGSSCGQTSSLTDSTNGSCSTVGQAYTNAKAAGGGVARVFIHNTSGGFAENLTLDYSGGGSEIRVADASRPRITGTGAGGTTLTINTTGDVRIFDVGISANGSNTNGIDVTQVATLELTNVELRGFAGIGLNFTPSSGTNSSVFITNSNLANATTGLVLIKPSSSVQVSVVVTNSQIHNTSGYGFRVDSTASSASSPIRGTLVRSVISNVANSAVVALANASGTRAQLLLHDTNLQNANNGVVSNGAMASAVLNGSSVSGNTIGISLVNSGVVFSTGNNLVQFNGTNVSGGALTSIGTQ